MWPVTAIPPLTFRFDSGRWALRWFTAVLFRFTVIPFWFTAILFWFTAVLLWFTAVLLAPRRLRVYRAEVTSVWVQILGLGLIGYRSLRLDYIQRRPPLSGDNSRRIIIRLWWLFGFLMVRSIMLCLFILWITDPTLMCGGDRMLVIIR